MAAVGKPAPQPPSDLELERTVIGCALGGLKHATWMLANVPKAAFAMPVHQRLYEAIEEFARDGSEPDVLTIKTRLSFTHEYDEAMESVLGEALEHAWRHHNLRGYGRDLMGMYARRVLMERSITLHRQAGEDPDIEAVMASAFDLGRGVPSFGTDTCRTGQIDIDLPENRLPGIPSLFPSLNSALSGGGYYVGEPSLIVARRGEGKTAFMTDGCLFAAQKGFKSAYATLEMPAVKVQRRMVQNLSGWTEPPMLSLTESGIYEDAKQRVKDLNIPIYDPSAKHGGDRTIEGLIAWAVDLHDMCGLDVLWVDYVQKLNSNAKRFDNRTRELDHIADELEWIAKRLGIAIIQASQITEDVGKVGTGRSKDSRKFEDNAALILYPKRKAGETETRVVVGKNRHGEEKILSLSWNGRYAKYEEPYDPYTDSD